MKLGSYVYHVNKIIYDMLFENENYTETLQGWANVSNYFIPFVKLTELIVKGIQAILRKVYSVVNKNSLGLSRQMEFHADTIAASVAGGNNLLTALSRVEVAGGCYSSAVTTASETSRSMRVRSAL